MAGERFEEVRAKMDEFLRRWPDAEFGPAHIILSDDNLESHWFGAIMVNLRAIARGRPLPHPSNVPGQWADITPGEADATLDLLDWILGVDEDERCPVDDCFEDAPGAAISRLVKAAEEAIIRLSSARDFYFFHTWALDATLCSLVRNELRAAIDGVMEGRDTTLSSVAVESEPRRLAGGEKGA